MIDYQSEMLDWEARSQSLNETIKNFNWFRFRENFDYKGGKKSVAFTENRS